MNTMSRFNNNLSRRKFLERSIKSGMALAAESAVLSTLTSCTTSRMIKKSGRVNPHSLTKKISNNFRRVKIAHIPTPIEYLKVLSSELNGPRIFIKRDDQTGLAFGGNKTRKMDFIIADANVKKPMFSLLGVVYNLIGAGRRLLLQNGLIDLVRNNYFKKDDCVLFIHTRGTPALFP